MINVLVGCECSGKVRDAFKLLGANAWSCDLKPSEVGGNHFKMSVFDVIDKYDWHIGIMHPPCTFVASSGAVWLDSEFYPNRRADRAAAIEFAERLWRCKIPHLALENPVGGLSTSGDEFGLTFGKPTQIIQPWQFGEEYQKSTCLWLKNLPQLRATDVVGKGEFSVFKNGKRQPKWFSNASQKGGAEGRRSIRSRTFQGIADAMATQWITWYMERSELTNLFML